MTRWFKGTNITIHMPVKEVHGSRSWTVFNKSFLFVGDSLTRYQFFGFAYFLEHKKCPTRFHTSYQCIHVDDHGNEACSKREDPNVCAEVDGIQLGGCGSYYQNLGGGSDGVVYCGRMESQSVCAELLV